MRILLVNKFYYRRGGDCTAVLEMERLLAAKGHKTAMFSVRHPQNEESRWESYFPSNVDFSSPRISGKLSAAARLFHSAEVARLFTKLMDDFRPDVVHLHNIHSYISPLVAKIARRKGARVVWTLHDHKLICPTYLCLRKDKICEKCFHKPHHVFTGKCMKNSYPASLLAWMEALYWNKRKLTALTDVFICPSNFLRSKMIEAGFPARQIEVLSNFMPQTPIETDETQTQETNTPARNYYCYAGRLSAEKGIVQLLRASALLPYQLKVAGDGPLFNFCRNRYETPQFLGRMEPKDLYPVMRQARLLVAPSVCYDNNPFSIIEALCHGVPVLGARIGGIPELINEGENGFLFNPNSIVELREGIQKCFNHFDDNYNFDKIAADAQNKFGADAFYNKLMKIYDHE